VVILSLFLLFYIALSISLYFLFPKVDKAAWKGLIPGLNFVEWCDIIGRPTWHALLLLVPILNIFVFSYMAIELVRSFGYYDFKHSFLAVIATPLILFHIAFNKSAKFLGPNYVEEKAYLTQVKALQRAGKAHELQKLQRKSPFYKAGERLWAESLIFAIFAAAFIRMFLIEAYVIPTPSMESSLLVGDYLFVSKVHYGLRTPMTVFQVPLLHNRIPFINRESYLSSPSLPYFRLPGITPIHRNDPFVFNWPIGDSVYITPQRSFAASQVADNPPLRNYIEREHFKLVVRPIDKKDHYIKRCIAIAGDTLQLIDRQVYINGKAAKNPSKIQHAYRVTSTKTHLNPKVFERLGINVKNEDATHGVFYLYQEQVDKLKALGNDVIVEIIPNNEDRVFPHNPKYFHWTVDNYGPIWIPKKGATVQLNKENIDLYKRIISVYEHNDFRIEDNKFIINGQPANSYTFKQNYYWAMGDNRHQSEDSRFWGFVPEDHIVGKPLFIFFSTKNGKLSNGLRWNRIFSSANKM